MRAFILLFGLLASLGVRAAGEPVGFVKTASGAAWIVTGATRVPAQPGTPVYADSQLRTGQPGSLGVSFGDDTMIACGPDTTLNVEEYHYAPSEGRLSFVVRLARGTLEYLSGVIAKLRPDAVAVKTPSGVIGIRGTHFVAKVEEE
jgi:hypothetical protein